MSRSGIAKYVGTALLAAGVLLALGDGCDGGREGERCNPLLSHDECGKGLSCQQPATCAESYCCPQDPATSVSAFCNGAGCPVPEAGADSSSE